MSLLLLAVLATGANNKADNDAYMAMLMHLQAAKIKAATYTPKLRAGCTPMPSGALRYTQFLVASPNRVSQIGRTWVRDAKWTVPGGMLGVKGWSVEKHQYVPGPVVYTTAQTMAESPFGGKYPQSKLVRHYPDGTRFDEVLRNSETGKVFEHRMRKKENGKWKSSTVHTDPKQFPKGYHGLKQDCATCHTNKETETAKYAHGLVPGGDTIISDPLDFSVLEKMKDVVYFKGQPPARDQLVRLDDGTPALKTSAVKAAVKDAVENCEHCSSAMAGKSAVAVPMMMMEAVPMAPMTTPFLFTGAGAPMAMASGYGASASVGAGKGAGAGRRGLFGGGFLFPRARLRAAGARAGGGGG